MLSCSQTVWALRLHVSAAKRFLCARWTRVLRQPVAGLPHSLPAKVGRSTSKKRRGLYQGAHAQDGLTALPGRSGVRPGHAQFPGTDGTSSRCWNARCGLDPDGAHLRSIEVNLFAWTDLSAPAEVHRRRRLPREMPKRELLRELSACASNWSNRR